MPGKSPKCAICGKGVQIMSYDTGYMKVVRPGVPKASFICWKCAEKMLGENIKQIPETA